MKRPSAWNREGAKEIMNTKLFKSFLGVLRAFAVIAFDFKT
jgi:hypothetical protein